MSNIGDIDLISAATVAGTNIAGKNVSLRAGASTGTGIGGSILLQTTSPGVTGTGVNPWITRVTIDNTGLTTFANNVTVTGNLISTTGAFTTGLIMPQLLTDPVSPADGAMWGKASELSVGDGFHYRRMAKIKVRMQGRNRELGADRLNILDYGAIGDYTHDDSDALEAAWADACFYHLPLYIPHGRYKITRNILFNCNVCAFVGVSVYGDGPAKSILDARGIAFGPAFKLYANYNESLYATQADARSDNFYQHFSDVAFLADCIGPVMQIGEQHCRDPVNEARFNNVSFSNSSDANTARALELNFVVQSNFDILASCHTIGRNGIAVTIRMLMYSHMFGSFGTGDTGIYITGGLSSGTYVYQPNGFTMGNTFEMDIENVATCVRIDGPNSQNNVFMGGIYSWGNNPDGSSIPSAFSAGNGHSNLIINPSYNIYSPYDMRYFILPENSVGLQVIGMSSVLSINTPPVPDTGQTIENRSGQHAQVVIWGPSVTGVAISEHPFGAGTSWGIVNAPYSIPPSFTYPVTGGTFILRAGQGITLTHSGVKSGSPSDYYAGPYWRWTSIG